ncbi:TetR/AcrR family transcriptional regulator [Nonomuraea sp. NN258]|nr:TetR/AcrR family transcriptional regulator [Nonomuraea antri]
MVGRAASATPQGWRERMESSVRQAWEIRKRHPWLAEVRGSRHVPGPNSVAYYDHLLATVMGTGLRPSEVIAVVGLVGRFVDAEALLLVEAAEEERRSGVSEEEWWGARGSLFERLDRYPTISALWTAGGWDEPEDPFEFGLRRLLDGIEALIQERGDHGRQDLGGTGIPGGRHQRHPGDERRDEKRDETSVCEECGAPLEAAPSGRPRVYCSRACRQRAYRKRQSN